MEIDRYTNTECVFCQIVVGRSPACVIAEDDHHLAILNKFPNTEAATVVVAKTHYDSYFANVEQEIINNIVVFSRKVAKLICKAYPDVARCALVFEGYGVDHLHSKLIPLHKTNRPGFSIKTPKTFRFYRKYPGYITTKSPIRAASLKDLSQVADKIKRCAQRKNE